MKNRKDDHIKISLEEKVEVGHNGFEDVVLSHNALPEVSLDYVDISTEFLGKKLKYPFIIEAMTGGTEEALAINEAFANVAEDLGVGIGVGSQRPAMENKALEDTYSVVKKAARNTLKIANLGAVQLNYGYGITECQLAVDMIGADALAIHLNPLQEVVQPEGNVNFTGLVSKISEITKKLSVPVIVKEVGCGISKPVAQKLILAGVQIIDVGGYGGTSWNLIEGFRATGEKKEISEIFSDWGIPTAYSLLDIADEECKKIASGGMRTGIDAAKALALGADLVGFALPLLKALDDQGEDGVYDYLHQMADELRVAMFLTGSANIAELKGVDYKLVGKAAQISR